MRAVLIHGRRDLRVEDAPAPEPRAGQVLVRPAYVGICGSDVHYYLDGAAGVFRIRQPLVPGHEIAGFIADDPSGHLSPGTPVAVRPATWGSPQAGLEGRPHLWAGGAFLGSASTWPHTHGGMAQYVAVAAEQARQLPDGLPLRRAALAEPLAVGLHAVAVAGGVEGLRVVVSGAGPIGLLTALAALARGAAEVTVTDVREEPLDRARRLGVHAVLRVDLERLPHSAFDVALECAGVPPALESLVQATRKAGVIVQVGNLPDESRPVNLAPLVSKELQIRGSFRSSDEIDEALAVLAGTPAVDNVIAGTYPLARAQEAFAAAADTRGAGKVLVEIDPSGDPPRPPRPHEE